MYNTASRLACRLPESTPLINSSTDKAVTGWSEGLVTSLIGAVSLTQDDRIITFSTDI